MSSVGFALQSRTFRSLRRHHNYRLFFAGQIVSLAGSWMQNVALAWLVLSLSRSPLAVATLLFCRFAPYTLLGLFAGSIVDRLDTRRLVVWTQVAAMVDVGCARARDADGHRDAPDRVRPRDARRRHTRARRAGPAGAHIRDGRPERAAERRRPQLGPVERVQDHRPGDRGSADRSRGRRHLFRRQHLQLRRGARCAARDARDRALSGRARSHRHGPRRNAGRNVRSPGATARSAQC